MNTKLNESLWISENSKHITRILDLIFNILEKNKNKYNYKIDNNIIKELVYYIYDNSDSKYSYSIY